MPTAAAFVASDAAAVDKATLRTHKLSAFGAPVTHPPLRAAWITGRHSTLMAGSAVTISTSPSASRSCPPSRWNPARDQRGTVPAIVWNGCPRSVEYAAGDALPGIGLGTLRGS